MIKKIVTFLFLLIALTALTLLITLIPEILGSELTSDEGIKQIQAIFGEHYIWWLVATLIVAVVVLFFFTPDQIKGIFKRDAKPIALSPEETQKNYATIRQYLLEKRYRPRLQQKLAGDQLFNLRVKPTAIGASPEKAATFVTLQGRKTGEEICQIFEQSRRRLLVTGMPGAGKTSLLLHLAIELLETDQENLTVVLNLATWNSSFATLDDWLREIFPAELGVTKRYAADILQQGKLTLLLDGLDEVDEVQRASCLDAIKVYGGKKQKDFVISTRKDEYKALEKDAPVWAQIEVLPLTKTQILTQLDHADRRDFPEAPDLKAALENDPLLLQVAETPFYLNCLQLLFRGGSTLSELGFKGEKLEARQTEIVERFTRQALEMSSPHSYTQEQVRYWLSFFASRLMQRNKVVFELVDLQYDWWRWGKLTKLIALQVKALASSITALFFAVVFAHLTYIMYLIFASFSLSLLELRLTYFFFFIYATTSTIVIFYPFLNWNIGIKIFTFDRFVLSSVDNLLSIFLMAVLMGVVVGGFMQVTYGSKIGVLMGTFFTLILGIHLLRTSSNAHLLQITTPYQRFIASAKALHFSILQHWLLRWQLYRAGVLPFGLVDFLNEMTARHLLETDGATWRFRHRILQEHFAQLWQEPKT